jgi:magnesium transporter
MDDQLAAAGAAPGFQAGLRAAVRQATRAVPVAHPDDRVDAVLAGMRGHRYDSAAVVAVCAGDRLAGLATIEGLLAAAGDATIRAVMDADPPVVGPDTDQEHAAWAAVQRGEPGLAVVDSVGRFAGLIPPQRLLAVLREEHDEDLARLGGYLHSTAAARAASVASVPRRLWHRLPWLLLGLAGALATAGVVGAFGAQLERQVLIAFFIPGVVYLADAVGTQTEALVIRGLSVGVGVRQVAGRELVTGLLVGILLAAAAYPLIRVLWGQPQVAAAVAVALLAACAIATAVAMVLPWLLSRLGADPAYGAGPLATVVQDLLSIAVYFTAATIILT